MPMVISRKYEVLDELGQGSMGTVYRVRHTALDTVFALKVLSLQLVENQEVVTRFIREARMMARLHHPHIVRVLDIDRDERLGVHYFVMEYIQGKTLHQYIQERGRLSLVGVLTASHQVAQALAYIHHHTPPIVHRDIKPANLMLEDHSGRLVVMDFGTAKMLDHSETTTAGALRGTVRYCPPEQLRHESLDGSADIYALGMVMYEAYTGKHLFSGLSESAVMSKLLYDPHETEPLFLPTTPTPFAALVTRAMAKSRERRYRSVEDFLRDLEACQQAVLEDSRTMLVPLPTKGKAQPEENSHAAMPQPDGRVTAEPQQQKPTSLGGRGTLPPHGAPLPPLGQNPQEFAIWDPAPPVPESEVALELDADHWEIGDEEKLAVARPFARKKREAWRLRVSVGVVAISALATFAWWGTKRLSPPTPPLTIVQSDPEEETAHVVEGEDLIFVVEVSGALPVQYEWTLDGHRVSQEPYWSYQPAPGEGGQTAKTVTLRLTDHNGQTLEKRWQVTVLHIPRPPQVLTVSPSQDSLQLASGATQEFHLNSRDPENEGLTYEWTVDGVAAGAQPTLSWKVPKEGLHQIRARVRNQAGLAITHEWQVIVLAPPPVPEPLPLPKNTPPRIAQYAPSERALTLREQESRDFSALATDTEGDSLAYTWTVDGQKVTQEDHFLFIATETGKHRIEVEVADQGGLKDKRRWEVFVEPLPAAPRLVMFTPQQTRFLLYPHLSRFFGVTVEVPGVVEPPLQYDWKVDGRSVTGREVFEFKNQSPGRHEVEVSVTGPSGASITHSWTVEVLEEQETGSRAPIWAPYLEVFDLDNVVSPNRKAITVTGKLRNIDERSAENVLVWISALDQQGQRVFRRLTLPIPQPLAPGHVAAFQASFANDDAIVDFRVEVVSK